MFTPSAASNSEVTVSRDQKDQKVSNSKKISQRKASKRSGREREFYKIFFFFSYLAVHGSN